MNKKVTLFLFISLFFYTAFSQELPEITPLSPNAASIVKYGEIPVGHFTGVPSISIPIYTVSSGELNLPLSLSYHAGGNRVESIASWVGLGWSLGSIPSISRSVRGIPDEKPKGYFSTYSSNNYTVEDLWNLGSGNTYNEYLGELVAGTADSEPDIFSYSIPGESGKFFWNQEDEEFITLPKSNTKIERDGTGFKLTTQSGIEYMFNIIENSRTDGLSQGELINSTWKASLITSASKKDTIHLYYAYETQVSKAKPIITKYHRLYGNYINNPPSLPGEGSVLNTNTIFSRPIDSIAFKDGYAKFNRNLGNDRIDLDGSYSLGNISVYNSHDQLVNKHAFTYRFKQGSGSGGGACTNADIPSKNWMLLEKVEQVSTTSPSDKLTHTFTYNENSFPACRYSAAQDYWGYYNGEDLNVDLTPPYYLPGSNNQISGADRSVDPTKSSYGILTKITYPTGGYTEFDFENNEAYANDLPPTYISDYLSIAGEEYFPLGATVPQTSTFTKQFILNNPSDLLLNNNNPSGGGTVNFIIGEPGCDLSQGASSCARFTVKGLTTGSNTSTIDITIEGKSFYLPNGTYELKASFDQSPAEYENFYFIADWQKIDPDSTGNTYTGGLRVKEIRSYANATATPITKRYKYTTAYDSTVSSGDIFSTPNFSHETTIRYDYYEDIPSIGAVLNQLQYLQVRSTTNMQQISHSGSSVGYKTVFEETDDPNKTGYTEYHFSNARDESGESFPYPPPVSFELERGQLVNQTSYKKNHSIFDTIQNRNMTYTNMPFETSTLYPKSSFAIKWANKILSNYNTPTYNYAQNKEPYIVYGGWNNIYTETNTSYNDNGAIGTSSINYYDNPAHLLKTRTHTTDSRGVRMISQVKYPQDISSPPSAITGLITQNRLGEAIETKNYKDLDDDGVADSNEMLNTQQNDYRVWYNSLYDIISPEFVKSSKGSQALEDRITYHSYYGNGNVREVSKADGPRIVYIWGYQEEYPIAKIENATYSQVSGHVQNLQNLSNLDDDRTEGSIGKEGDLRDALANLRNTTALSGAMVTTYTYDPLIGVTSMTDPKGYTLYYEYDSFNRLRSVKDSSGNLVSDYEYHYKGQLQQQ